MIASVNYCNSALFLSESDGQLRASSATSTASPSSVLISGTDGTFLTFLLMSEYLSVNIIQI